MRKIVSIVAATLVSAALFAHGGGHRSGVVVGVKDATLTIKDSAGTEYELPLTAATKFFKAAAAATVADATVDSPVTVHLGTDGKVVEVHLAAAAKSQAKKAALTVVKNNLVCMINEQFMNREQIPVEVEGKTYYGCCEGCKQTLAADASTRVAKDPVSGKEVDKATAVIGADESGRVYYFENEANLNKYVPAPASR